MIDLILREIGGHLSILLVVCNQSIEIYKTKIWQPCWKKTRSKYTILKSFHWLGCNYQKNIRNSPYIEILLIYFQVVACLPMKAF